MYLTAHINIKEAQRLGGLGGSGGSIFLIWVCYLILLLSHRRAAHLEWGPEPEKVLQYVQLAVKAALSLGPYDPSDPVVLEVSV